MINDAVIVRQMGTCVSFEFDHGYALLRDATITHLGSGIYITLIDREGRHVNHMLSDSARLSRRRTWHALKAIENVFDLSQENKQDIGYITMCLEYYQRERRDKLNENDDIYRLIEAADKCRREIVLCLLGKPGIGKTEAVERFAKDHGRKVVHIIASQILPSEVSGMTMPNQKTRSMDVFDHYRLSHMEDGDILFFDELLKGQQQVLNACLTLIQERRLMSGTELPDVLVIAAANPLATPLQLPLEIRQRFMFVDVKWNRLQWCEYMKALGFDKAKFIDRLSKKVDSMLGKDDAWNTLTPRTATKLCLWLRDSNNDWSVRDFIMDAFGSDVLHDISDAVFGSKIKSSEVQAAEKVIEILTPMFIDPEHAGQSDKIDEAMCAARAVANEETTDLTELLSKLQALPEWGDIQEVLSASEIKEEKITF